MPARKRKRSWCARCRRAQDACVCDRCTRSPWEVPDARPLDAVSVPVVSVWPDDDLMRFFANMLRWPENRERWNVPTPKPHRLPTRFRSLTETDFATKRALFEDATKRLDPSMVAALSDVMQGKRKQRHAAQLHGVSELALRKNVERVAERMKIILANCHTSLKAVR